MSSSRSFVVIPGSRALDTRQFMELLVTIKACEGRRESQVFWSLVLAISFFFDARETAMETDATNRTDRRRWGAKQSKAKHERTHARLRPDLLILCKDLVDFSFHLKDLF